MVDPVVNPLLDGVALSPSRANDFLTCPLLFRYRAIDHLPEVPTPSSARGTLVHSVLERLFAERAEHRTVDRATEMIEPTWQDLLATDEQLVGVITEEDSSVWLQSAADLVEGYFALEDPARIEPHATELSVDVNVGEGLRLKGIIDRLDVNPAGLMRVVDYKTGKSPSAHFEQKAQFQMRFYALILWRLRGAVPARLQLMYLGDGQVLHFTTSEQELERFERTLRSLWNAILTNADQHSFRPKRNALCRFCPHRSHCPEGGGTMLELPTRNARSVDGS